MVRFGAQVHLHSTNASYATRILNRDQKIMKISGRFLLNGIIWSIGSFGITQALRFVTNVILARLLAPQLFGIMVIVNSVRIGIEFISDIGVGQNVVYHKDANDPEFYNTAWTLQAIRGIGIWLVASILAVPVARFYQLPILIFVVPLMAFTSVLAGFSSISLSLLQKRLQIVRANVFDTTSNFVGAVAVVLFAYFSPTIWALVFSFIFGCTVSMIASYFVLPDIKHQFRLSKRYVWDILHFGKWVFASSIVFFLSMNFDRLYLAKVVNLEMLGVYGIARSIAETLGAMVQRLGTHVLFPFIVSHSQMPRSELREQLGRIRVRSLLLAGLGFSVLAATADLPIKLLYDERYQAANWMLPLLIIGSWFSVLSYVNESTLLGLGKPIYTTISNSSKFAFLLIGIPLSVTFFGLFGAIIVVVLCDLFRYFPILISQRREHFSFGIQDLFVTLATFLLVGLWEWLRFVAGFGNSFETLPIDISAFFVSGR
jgi:O-antigen/teichoic acid export membrane protein